MPTDQPDPRVRRTQRDVVGATTELLREGGLGAVTHATVADRAGYSRATVYNHWPDHIELLRAGLEHMADLPHHQPTGRLRQDLIGELEVFGDELTNHGTARVIAGLAERAGDQPELANILRGLSDDGSSRLRAILLAHGTPVDQLPATVAMLAGAVFYRVTCEQLRPTNKFIESVVDTALRSIATYPSHLPDSSEPA